MSGEDEGREGGLSHPLHRLVMKALVEKRGAERVPQLADASTAAADDEVALQG